METQCPYISWTEGLIYHDIAYTERSSWKPSLWKTNKPASLLGATRQQIQRSLEEVPRCIESWPISHLLCHLCGGAVPPICRFPHLQLCHLQHLLDACFASPLKTFASDHVVYPKCHIATWLGSKMCHTACVRSVFMLLLCDQIDSTGMDPRPEDSQKCLRSNAWHGQVMPRL